jgi:hypothetical protein
MLEELLAKLQNPNFVSQVSSQLGVDESTASQAIHSAIPSLVGAMARNAESEEGASSLHEALGQHDGSVLDDLDSYGQAPNTEDGNAILGHVFGGKQEAVASGLSSVAGLDPSKMGGLMAMLAPLVMGALGKTQATSNLGSGDLGGALGGMLNQLGGGQDIMGVLGKMLDQNHDGNVMDDLQGMLGSLFGKK